MTVNHIACQAGDGEVRRGEAVIRSNGHEQLGWHKDCWTLHRAVGHIVVVELSSMPLTRRLEAMRERVMAV